MSNIAFLFDEPVTSGGGFQQSISFLIRFLEGSTRKDKYYLFTTNSYLAKYIGRYISSRDVTIVEIRKDYLTILASTIFNTKPVHNILKTVGVEYSGYYDALLHRHRIDLLIFLSPSLIARGIGACNFMIPVWDLDYRLNNEFPEVSWHGESAYRQSYYSSVLVRAYRVIVESELSKKLVIQYFGIDEHRIIKVNFVPSELIKEKVDIISEDIVKKYGLKKKYILYPAQFWPHKNHVYIIKAMDILRRDYCMEDLGVVFCGSDRGTLGKINEMITAVGLENQVKSLGFVSETDLVALYKNALAVVMPAYMGFSNLPPIEAVYWGIPVFYSDLPQFHEQMGDSVIYVDLKNPSDLAYKIQRLIVDEEFQRDIAERMLRKRATLEHDSTMNSVFQALNDYDSIAECWRL